MPAGGEVPADKEPPQTGLQPHHEPHMGFPQALPVMGHGHAGDCGLQRRNEVVSSVPATWGPRCQ